MSDETRRRTGAFLVPSLDFSLDVTDPTVPRAYLLDASELETGVCAIRPNR